MNKENNEHIDLGGLSMDKLFNSMNMDQFKLKSPATKINFCLENKLVVTGVQLMCAKEEPAYDLSDLNDNTLISIDKHHLIECILMIYGALYTAIIANKIKYDDDTKEYHLSETLTILQFYRNGLLKYGDCKKYNTLICENIIDRFLYEIFGPNYVRFGNDCYNEHFDKFKHILDNIWFLPYSEIDKLKETITSEINGVNNNESNDQSIK